MVGSRGHCARLPCTRSDLTSGPSAMFLMREALPNKYSTPLNVLLVEKGRCSVQKPMTALKRLCMRNRLPGVEYIAGPTRQQLTAGQTMISGIRSAIALPCPSPGSGTIS